MNEKELIEVIKKGIEEIINEPIVELSRGTLLGGTLGEENIGLTSYDYVNLIIWVEEKFDIVIDFEVSLFSVGDIVDYIINYN